MNLNDLLIGYPMRRLDTRDVDEVQKLFERCSDYFELIAGEATRPDEAEHAFERLPGRKQISEKFVIGVYAQEDGLVGLVDLVRDHPSSGVWTLGLLLLDPAVRGKRIGSRIYPAITGWLQEQGARAISIGVLEENTAAERFWLRQGFKEIRRQSFVADSGKEHRLIVLDHKFGPEPATVEA